MKPVVVFLHGLARSQWSMARVRYWVSRQGFETWTMTYQSRSQPMEALADRVYDRIVTDLGVDTPLLAVTHSMGGILVRYLGDRLNWQGAFMMAPPNQGSEAARTLDPFKPFHAFYGPAGEAMTGVRPFPPPPEPTVIVAGSLGLSVGNPLSVLTSAVGVHGEAPHDGLVAVHETRLDGEHPHRVVAASHTWIMDHPETRRLLAHFLEHRELPEPVSPPARA